MGWILAKIDQRWILLIIGVLCAVSGLAEAQASPPLTRAEKEEFLRTAEQRVPPPGPRHDRGDPPAFRTLTDGHLSHRVDFNSLDLYRSGVTVLADGTRMFGFRDSYRYTIAAYELDKLLGLNMVLVSVGRDLDGKTGAVTWVLEDVRMTEVVRRSEGVAPPDPDAWNSQMNRAWIFTELVHDIDARPVKLLIDSQWKLWISGLSQAFHETSDLIDEPRLEQIDRDFYEALGRLSLESVSPTLSTYLSEQEMQSLLTRRDRIIEVFDEAARSKGVDAVITKSP